jgi:hypothetical protein
MNPHDELRALYLQVDQVPDLQTLTGIYYRIEEIAKAYPNDFQVQMMVGDLKQQMTRRAAVLQQGPQAAPPPPAPAPPAAPVRTSTMNFPTDTSAPTQMMSSGVRPPAPPAMAPPPPVMAPPPPVVGPPPPMAPPPPAGPPNMAPQALPPQGMPPQPPQAAAGGGGGKGMMIGGAVVLLLLLGGGAFWFMKNRGGGGAPAGPTAHIATVPPGAAIRINDENKCSSDCDLALAPGDYQVVALLDGYEAAAGALTVKAGETASLSLNLEPQPQTVRVLTDLAFGKIKLDDQPDQDLIEGQFTFERVPTGAHTLTVSSQTGQATLRFELANAKQPLVTGSITANSLLAVAVASFAKQARVTTSTGPLKMVVNGKPQQDADTAGVDLSEYEPGVSEIILGDGNSQKNVKENFTPSPALTLFLKSEENIGTLIVATGGENDVHVFVNNKEWPRRTARGEVRVRTIGKVTVRVAKDGLESSAPQVAEVKKGGEVRLDFTLKPAANFSSLQIRSGTPGADVLVDSKPAGAIGADGTFANNSIVPGTHVIELRREGYQPKRLEREFKAGQPVNLTSGEATLVNDRPQTKEVPPPIEKKVEPPPAPKPAPPPPPKILSMGEFEQPDAWKETDGVFVHRGSAYLTYRQMPRGTYNFTIQLRRGGNIFRGGRVRWFVDYKNFWVKDVVNGKTTERSKTEHKAGEKTWTVQLEVTADKLVHKMQINGQWYNLDSWEQSGRDFTDGRFGFLVQGDNEIAVSDFRFTPAR